MPFPLASIQRKAGITQALGIQFAVDWVNVGVSPIRKVNYPQHPEKWYIKATIIASKCENKYFATQPWKLNAEVIR